MVRQYVARGENVWNFPGGQIEPGESLPTSVHT
ncbi:NUDIX hydrolase [Exiguobacterium sp.]